MTRRARVVWRQISDWPWVALIIVGALVIVSALAGLIAPHDPFKTDLGNRLAPPWFLGGTRVYPLGTDGDGRDILTRLIFGARIDLPLTFLSLTCGAGLGSALGIVAGYFGDKIDALLMRAADLFAVYPIFLVAILLAVVRGPSTFNVVIAVVFTLWARFAVIVRGEVLSTRERDFVALAQAAGASSWRIMLRHILPNVAATIVVLAALQVGWVILVEASLSFLGAGVPPPAPSWGEMVAEGEDYFTYAWWVSISPGLAVMVAVLGFTLLSDWLRDALDPRIRSL